MKRIILPLLLLLLAPRVLSASEFNGPYIDSIFMHPASVPYSAGATFSSSFKANGGATMAGIAWHKADPHNTLMPQRLLDLGVKPVGWALNIGLGGNSGDYFVPMGLSANIMPTALGPGLKLMDESGNAVLRGISGLLSSKNGGVSFGPQWTAHPVENGTILPLNRWRFPPGWFLGASYAIK